MNPARVFAMATPSQINPASVGRSTTTDTVSPATAAAMCAGMPKLWYLAAMLKWADDWSGADYLEYRLWMEAAGMASTRGWEPPKGEEFLRRMAKLAIDEMGWPSKYKFDKDKCEYLGISPSTFCNRWKCRYGLIYQVLDGWASEGFRYVQRNNIDEGGYLG
ncbi:MAG: hypothetical protein KUF79_17275 [Candidatus Thiodiazotropha sp. (ex Ctena orbiculata)]|nr:hypothetical protein [Candidatus Thiodiazotropha taylori]